MVASEECVTRIIVLAVTIFLCGVNPSPVLPNFDIWDNPINPGGDNAVSFKSNIEKVHQSFNASKPASRDARVLNFFPLPVEEECLAKDGRRVGLCLNTYECRIQGGTARGSCALGFGVCCVFTTTCGGEVANNLTYIVSPGFPGLSMEPPATCEILIKKPSSDIAQLRFDFVHFNIGQPNRSTGVCDGDLFMITGGASPDFRLCGQNSGQHIYFNLLSRRGRQDGGDVRLIFNSIVRSLPRMWEIRVIHVAPDQRAPSGCLQLFTGANGTIQTMNYAVNGRHLADQNYRACIRQERGMCSIAYEPCHDGAFRIGQPPGGSMQTAAQGGQTGQMGTDGGATSDSVAMAPDDTSQAGEPPASADQQPGEVPAAGDPAADGAADAEAGEEGAGGAEEADDAVAEADDPEEEQAEADEPADDGGAADEEAADDPAAADEQEGSGGGGFSSFFNFPSFSFPSLFRSARQFSPVQCIDRITMPCIVEDFLSPEGGVMPPLCEPVHCGPSLCNAATSSCRLESSVIPFRLGIHFGPGLPTKGSPEDNLGACIRYTQVACNG